MRNEVVYLIQRGHEFKIGRTTNLKVRVATISTYSAVKPKVIHTIKTDQSATLEDMLKSRFASNRLNGEWFLLNDNSVQYIKAIKEWPIPTMELPCLEQLGRDEHQKKHRKISQSELSFQYLIDEKPLQIREPIAVQVQTASVTLQDLLKAKAGIQSSTELREKIGGSSAQISNLWHGRDTIGARLMLRILTAFPQITAEELSHVDEAKKALTPPKQPCRRRLRPRDDVSC